MNIYQIIDTNGNNLGLLGVSWQEGGQEQWGTIEDLVQEVVEDVFYEYSDLEDPDEDWFWDNVSNRLNGYNITADRVFVEEIVIP